MHISVINPICVTKFIANARTGQLFGSFDLMQIRVGHFSVALVLSANMLYKDSFKPKS